MNELTEQILGAMVDRVYVFDRGMRYLFVGRQAGEQLVRDPDTLLGLTGHEAGFPPETTDKVERLVQRVFSTAQPARLEMTHQIMQGERQRVECCASPIIERNAVKAVVVVSRDISGRPRRGGGPTGPNGPLSRMGDIGTITDGQPPGAGAIQDEAKGRNLKLALLDAVSHDFRSPLSAILMSLRAIADRGRVLSREAMQQLATEALPAAERMNDMIGSLLDLNRLRAEKVTPLLEAVSVRDLVHDVLACNSRKLRNRPVMVGIESAPRELYTDEMLLHTLIGNLLDNAVKYSPPGSPIELGARAEGEVVILYVADRGEGISEEYLSRVFEMAFQVPRSDGGPREGLGLGLSLCRLIAEELGGDIRLDPRPEGGTLGFGVAARMQGIAMTSREPQGPRVSVLVVDDEPALRRMLKVYLSEFGYEVAEAESGEALGSAVVKYHPKAVVLGLTLPGIDGVEALRLLREWSTVPVVVLSARDRTDEKVRALDAGADDYVTKPFAPDELEARLRAVIRRHQEPSPNRRLVVGTMRIELVARQVFCCEQEVPVTPTEWDLLRLLVTNADRVVSYRTLLTEVWGITHHSDYHVIRVTMSNLRRKLREVGCMPYCIRTEQGVGYRLVTATRQP